MISKEQAREFGSVKGCSKKVRRTSDSISLICSVRSQLKILKAPPFQQPLTFSTVVDILATLRARPIYW